MAEAPNLGSKSKSFWKRPEGMTGLLFLSGVILGGGYLITSNMAAIMTFLSVTMNVVFALIALAAILYMVFDPKTRNLVWYMYKSVMRWVTGLFVQIDPIGILKSYIDSLEDNLVKMRKQIGSIRGQMRKLANLMEENKAEINKNMKLASAAKAKGMDSQVVLSTRKAARLRESNQKYSQLHTKMEVLHRILTKMHQNSEILVEDTKDQVKLKDQERKVIRASHSAMKSARSIISGDPDKRAMFDAAMENIADDVASKVGEMEQFMEMSSDFMNTIDLQNGIFEEDGMNMLEKWEKESTLLLMGDPAEMDTLDLNSPVATPETKSIGDSNASYDNLFD